MTNGNIINGSEVAPAVVPGHAAVGIVVLQHLLAVDAKERAVFELIEDEPGKDNQCHPDPKSNIDRSSVAKVENEDGNTVQQDHHEGFRPEPDSKAGQDPQD